MDVSIVYIPKTKNSSFFKTFLIKKHGVAVLFDLVRLFAKIAFINDGFCSVPQ